MKDLASNFSHQTRIGPNPVGDMFRPFLSDQTVANFFELANSEYLIRKKKYALWRFVVNGAPLSADVTYQDGRWFAESDWLNLFGEGESLSDAIHSLSDHIAYFIEFYSDIQLGEHNLTEHAKESRDRFLGISQNP